jgi:hypothetical protein
VFSVSSGGLSENVDSLFSGGERNAGTVVVHVDGLVEDGESWVVWAGLGSPSPNSLTETPCLSQEWIKAPLLAPHGPWWRSIPCFSHSALILSATCMLLV